MRKGFLLIFLWISAQASIGAEKRTWIFFTDKGVLDADSGFLESGIGSRAMERRIRRAVTALPEISDLPVNAGYIQKLKDWNLSPRCVSRWLNAVSIELPVSMAERVKNLPFVRRIEPVHKYRSPLERPASGLPVRPRSGGEHRYDYGYSAAQIQQIRVDEVHDLGIEGRGVLIGVLDTGFNWRNHLVFGRMRVEAEYDFIQRDLITENQAGEMLSQHEHGTEVLAVAGGFHEGYVIGPAFGASFALAKTEMVESNDDTVEIDLWVEGLEWLESIGADVVTSSLAFYTFVNGPDYTYEMMDGNTAVPTIAADLAVRKGIVFISAAGNFREDPWQYIVSPADGDSVIAVGAVTSGGNPASFSSIGPTSDGRIKPDVMAMGVGVVTIDPQSYAYYFSISGTSVAAPLAAGTAALVLQAHPELRPDEVRDALRNTASQSASPDNEMGWGIIDAYEAVFYHGMVFANLEIVRSLNTQAVQIETDVLWKGAIRSDSVFVHFREQSGTFTRSRMVPMGSGGARFKTSQISVPDETIQFYFEAEDEHGRIHRAPYDAPIRWYTLNGDSGVPVAPILPDDLKIHPAYPNPFNDQTTIRLEVPVAERISLAIYNIRGQKVRTLFEGAAEPGTMEWMWNGEDDRGDPVASGIYLCRLRSGRKEISAKLLRVR